MGNPTFASRSSFQPRYNPKQLDERWAVESFLSKAVWGLGADLLTPISSGSIPQWYCSITKQLLIACFYCRSRGMFTLRVVLGATCIFMSSHSLRQHKQWHCSSGSPSGNNFCDLAVGEANFCLAPRMQCASHSLV